MSLAKARGACMPAGTMGLILQVIVGAVSMGYCQGWVGQGRISRPDGDSADGQPAIAVDYAGNPWVVWGNGDDRRTGLSYARWLGSRWSDESPIGPMAPGVVSRVAPSLAIDDQGVACATWTNLRSDNRMLAASCFWNGSDWGDEVQVSLPPDSSDSDYSSDVAWGGGAFWCVWGRGPTVAQPNRVYVSRWDFFSGYWEPEMCVSPPDGGHHWFSHLAVDNQGHPHVVWCEVWHRVVCYSYYDGHDWIGPVVINDTAQVWAPDRAAPRIAIDHQGGLHTCFTGVATGASSRDLFYSASDGTGWRPAVILSRDSIYNEWYSDIAVSDADNVWVVWERQGESTDQFRIHCSHFDGGVWSREERLDNDSSYYDGSCHVGLDLHGEPWVVWAGMSRGPSRDDIWYNRQLGFPVVENGTPRPIEHTPSLVVRELPAGFVRIFYSIPIPAVVTIDVLDELGRSIHQVVKGNQAAGEHVVEWSDADSRGRRAPSGVYFCRLRATGVKETCKFTRIVR